MTPPTQLGFFDDEDPPEFFNDTTPKFRSTGTKVWSKRKSHMIELYLRYFVFVTHHGVYIDGFAGPQYRTDLDKWTAKRVIESRPRWLRRFLLCDLNTQSFGELQKMISEQPPRVPKTEPKRQIETFLGDFNIAVDEILTSALITDKEATFCLLDQRTFECHWETVVKVAKKKTQSHKIEILYFLPIKWLKRAMAAQQDKDIIRRWWGGDDWQKLRTVSNDSIRQLFVEKFKGLGYSRVCSFPIFSGRDATGVMYYMIQASDHEEAPKLMHRAYKKAVMPTLPEQSGLFPDSVEFDDE